jgi:hypothetical protein
MWEKQFSIILDILRTIKYWIQRSNLHELWYIPDDDTIWLKGIENFYENIGKLMF